MKDPEQVLKSFIPDLPMDYSFFEDNFDEIYKQCVRLGKAPGRFAYIAFFLACMYIPGQVFQVCVNRV